ncbi:MAG: alpha-glucuronidase family glycosyl hydrolase [Deltaproteobacteria bacterium]
MKVLRLWSGLVVLALLCCCSTDSRRPPGTPGSVGAFANEDGYDLWLRYPRVADSTRLGAYQAQLQSLVAGSGSATLTLAAQELERGLRGLLGVTLSRSEQVQAQGSIVIGTPQSSPVIAALPLAQTLPTLGSDGYLVQALEVQGKPAIVVAGNRDVAVLFGAFALLRHLQTFGALTNLSLQSAPKLQRRILDHWDNLDRTVERGYAGQSLWDWAALPGIVSTRYRDYARANASIGINGAVLTNVNANAQVLTAAYLAKVKAIADELRPYGISTYLTARFSAPIEIGGLASADPTLPAVQAWWRSKADEIYALIPDFGGFLVKANSEGQPGPRDYGRSHAEGANALADALAPHHGIVMWRAFVYSSESPVDRIRQAYEEFHPLDGQFRPNVAVQVKNGPLDFQPREPFSPLFGAMPRTPLALELQLTKEYLGQDTHLAYLGPLYEEVLRADTLVNGPGSTVARVIDGSLQGQKLTVMAGVANVGSDRNWSGSHFNQANWYVFGRMAWDPEISAQQVAEEWVRETFSNDPSVVGPVTNLLMTSREAVVNYMTPLGLAHLMATHHHYGPGPWVSDQSRPEWNPTYYHKADAQGLGFDRTASGSGAIAQYAPAVAARFSSRASVPDELLLFFHHVGWNETLRSGRTLWNELVDRYSSGVSSARALGRTWRSVQGKIDEQRFGEIARFLKIQAEEARWWRDASLAYFSTFSGLPIPAKYEPPLHPLGFYQALRCPADVTKARCPEVYGPEVYGPEVYGPEVYGPEVYAH